MKWKWCAVREQQNVSFVGHICGNKNQFRSLRATKLSIFYNERSKLEFLFSLLYYETWLERIDVVIGTHPLGHDGICTISIPCAERFCSQICRPCDRASMQTIFVWTTFLWRRTKCTHTWAGAALRTHGTWQTLNSCELIWFWFAFFLSVSIFPVLYRSANVYHRRHHQVGLDIFLKRSEFACVRDKRI